MRRMPKAFYGGLFLAVLCMLLAGIFVGVKVRAISYKGPDPAEYGNANVAYTLSNSTNVYAPTTILPFYYPTRPATTLSLTMSCTSGPNITVDYLSPSTGSWVTITSDACGYFAGGNTLPSYVVTSTPDSINGYYKMTLRFRDVAAGSATNFIDFRLWAGSGGIIGYSATNDPHYAIANIDRCDASGDPGCGVYKNYTLPFAAPCSVATGTEAEVTITDPDNPSGSDDYGIQPTQFSLKVVELSKAGTVTRNPVSWTRTTVDYLGSATQQQNHYFFSLVKGRNYQLILTHVYSNNVIQFELPYDSINYNVPCTNGSLTGAYSADCTSLDGFAYDTADYDSTSPHMHIYTVINPAAGDAANAYPDYATFSADLTQWPGGATNATNATPTDVSANPDASGHGFSIPVPPPGYRLYNYAGPWAVNKYYIYMNEPGTSTVMLVDARSVGPCATATCNSSMTTFNPGTVKQTSPSFRLWLQGNSFGDSGLPDYTMSYSITGPPGSVYTGAGQTTPVTWAGSTNQVTTYNPLTITPDKSGTYTVTWSWNGGAPCSKGGPANYTPYFSVIGGDISAGAGVGSSCTDTTAQIESSNTNTDSAPNYFGAGTTAGAFATGPITNFVTGLGLGGGAGGMLTSLKGAGLAFSNAAGGANTMPTPPSYGGIFGGTDPNPLPCVQDYYSSHTGSDPGTSFDAGQVPSGAGTYNFDHPLNGFVTIGGAGAITMPKGVTVNLYVNGNVYIANNITYAAYTQPSEVPRFNLYVKGSISIDPRVTEIHGVYSAQQQSAGDPNSGNFATCETGPDIAPYNTQTYAQCNNISGQANILTIYGAVLAQGKMKLMRTHGSIAAAADSGVPGGTVPAEPAEIFKYTPELWLNSPLGNTMAPQAYTSLPPIF